MSAIALDLSPPMPRSGEFTVSSSIKGWIDGLPVVPLTEIVASPAATALFAVDLAAGCHEAERLAGAVAELVQAAHALGVRDVVLVQERRCTRNLTYSSFPSPADHKHGDIDPVAPLTRLPFASDFTVIPRHSLHPAIGTGFSRWLAEHPNLRTAIVVGVGADQAVYQTAMHLQQRARAPQLTTFRVVVPASLVGFSEHLPRVGDIGRTQGNAHPYHDLFLSHLALQGVRLVRALAIEESRP